MSTVRVQRKLESEILHLPELKPLIGKTVEITVVERAAAKSTPAVDGQGLATHTGRTLTLAEMTQELEEASQPSAAPSVPLKHKVDYSHVF